MRFVMSRLKLSIQILLLLTLIISETLTVIPKKQRNYPENIVNTAPPTTDEPDTQQGRYPEHVRIISIFGHTTSSSFDISAAKLFAYTDKGLLFNKTRLIVDILQLPNTDNMLEITGFLCAELQTATNLVGFILGGVSQPAWSYIVELARGWDVPVIDVFRDPALEMQTSGSFTTVKKFQPTTPTPTAPLPPQNTADPPMLLNLHTSYSHMASAIQDVITAYKWTRLVFLYDSAQSLMAMQSLLSDTYISKTSSIRETVIVQVSENNLFEVVKIALKVQAWTTVVVAFDRITTVKFLKAASRCGVLTSGYTFVLANFDAHLYSMEEFAHNWPNVTVLRPIVESPTSRHWLAAAKHFDIMQRNYRVLANDDTTGERISLPSKLDFDREFPFYLTSALVIDALSVFRQGISTTLPDFFEWVNVQPANLLTCTKTFPLLNGYGSYLFNGLRNVSIEGLTGPLRLNARTGFRDRVTIDVLALSSKGLVKIGDWRSSITDIGFSLSIPLQDQAKHQSIFLWRPLAVDEDLLVRLKIPPEDVNTLYHALLTASIKKRILTVTTLLEKPYAMTRERGAVSGGGVPGSSRAVNFHNLEGFCIDLIDEISAIVGFNYKIQVVGDGRYGKYDNASGRWNGLIGELIDKKADIAVAPLTITYARETVVDFTKPFLHLGISILHVQPQAAPPSLFAFMDPLAHDVWAAICISCVAVTAVFFVVGRCSPQEFDFNDDEKTEQEKHPYTCGETSWFVVGGFLGLGSAINPQAMSTRVVTMFWWFFSLIIISTYTANLAAFLTIEQHESPFENVEEMSLQTSVLYGTLKGGSTENFFREAKIETYQRMWAFMKDQDVFARSNSEGIDRVIRDRGKYAYLMESVSLQYVLEDGQQNTGCKLRQVGGLLDSKGYGLATRRQSPYRDLLSMAILQLQETDKLQMLFTRWWKGNTPECGNDSNKPKAMGVYNVLGIFLVLGFGFAASLFIVFIEVLWNIRRPVSQRSAFCQRFGNYVSKTISTWCSSERPHESRKDRKDSLRILPEETTDEKMMVGSDKDGEETAYDLGTAGFFMMPDEYVSDEEHSDYGNVIMNQFEIIPHHLPQQKQQVEIVTTPLAATRMSSKAGSNKNRHVRISEVKEEIPMQSFLSMQRGGTASDSAIIEGPYDFVTQTYNNK